MNITRLSKGETLASLPDEWSTDLMPVNRLAQPEEIGNRLSHWYREISPYMNGQTVLVDGGWSVCDINYDELGKHIDTQNY